MPAEPPGFGDPLDPAGLVGRAAEAAAIRRMLDGAPLVTVTGLPGVGKTAVSLAAARAAAADFADGSLLLRLDTLRDEALLPHTIAAALRLSDQYTRSRLDVLVDQLRDRHLLLILDTCEHLLGACAAALIAGPAAALPDRLADSGPRFLLPVTLRSYGRQMLRRLGQDEEFAARHKRWQDDRRPRQGTPAGK